MQEVESKLVGLDLVGCQQIRLSSCESIMVYFRKAQQFFLY